MLAISEFINEKNITSPFQLFESQQFLMIDDFMPRDFIYQYFLPEVKQCEPFVHRVNLAGIKKSGSVSAHDIKTHAPELFTLYHSDWVRERIEEIVGEKLFVCPDHDPHALALYYYTKPGDHIGVHFDKSFYRGRRYTVLLGLIQDSIASKLICYPHATKWKRRRNPIEIYTHPGMLVVFNGDVLWHEVTPLAENEKRVILSMEYVTDQRMSTVNQFISSCKDRWFYFGKRCGSDLVRFWAP
ncbi:MAG: 2OG-Fe(II) oxygenase [Gammaproteobacteria bacterium]|nr:2OG-Fe(II) oxygenase [Gammaproteobacteria bacterium]